MRRLLLFITTSALVVSASRANATDCPIPCEFFFCPREGIKEVFEGIVVDDNSSPREMEVEIGRVFGPSDSSAVKKGEHVFIPRSAGPGPVRVGMPIFVMLVPEFQGNIEHYRWLRVNDEFAVECPSYSDPHIPVEVAASISLSPSCLVAAGEAGLIQEDDCSGSESGCSSAANGDPSALSTGVLLGLVLFAFRWRKQRL